jgi:hypothetical protein
VKENEKLTKIHDELSEENKKLMAEVSATLEEFDKRLQVVEGVTDLHQPLGGGS